MCIEGNRPWDLDSEMLRRLKAATLRYAALTGVADPDEFRNEKDVAIECLDICSRKPESKWDDARAVAFIQAVTGYDAAICSLWLVYEWDIDVPLSCV